MHEKRHRTLLGVAAFVIVLCEASIRLGAAQQPEEITIIANGTHHFDEAGNERVQITMTFSPPRGYDRVKRAFPNLYVLFRDFGPERSSFEVNRETLRITSDDGQRSITLSAEVLGASVCRRNRWQIELSKEERLTTQDANKVFTSFHQSLQPGVKMTGTYAYLLPSSAQTVQFNSENRLVTYTLPHRKVAGKPLVDPIIRFKKRLMAAVYKVYADSEAEDGKYWVVKAIVKNTGPVPIYDLKVYYKLGDYADMSIPEYYSIVMPQGAAVDCYYPVINSKVAELKTRTPVQLFLKYEYKDGAGQLYSEEMTRRLEILGVNQFEFSNLNDEDRSDSWFDHFNNSRLLAAFVTKNDDAVKQFAGYVSEAAGGAAAASNSDDAKKWLRAAYEMQLANNIVYQTPSGFVTQDRSSGQDIKYPRDVFRDKSGTCVDLAITYASLAEAVGLRSYLMLVPGHCFAVIQLPDGNLLPVENTGLGGGERRLSFEQAVETGTKEWAKYLQEGLFYLVDVKQELTAGRIPNPELPAVGADFLEKAGIQRLGAQRGSISRPAPGVGGAKPFMLAHDHGGTNFGSHCIGLLAIARDRLVYEAVRSNDGQMHKLEFLKADIKEAKPNMLPMGGYRAFHIRLKAGLNYNFAHINEYAADLGPDAVLIEILRD